MTNADTPSTPYEPSDVERAILQLLDESPEIFRRSLFSEQFIASQLELDMDVVAAALDALESAGLIRLTRTRTSFGRSAALRDSRWTE